MRKHGILAGLAAHGCHDVLGQPYGKACADRKSETCTGWSSNIRSEGGIIGSTAIAKEVYAGTTHALISAQAIQEGGNVVPELTTCEQCGRTVIVLSWAPVYEDAVPLIYVDDSHTLTIDCKIDCPACGTRIQGVVPSTDVEPA